MNLFKIVKRGIVDENPTFVQVIGMCPTLAVTTAAINGLAMGLLVTGVLSLSNLLISLFKNIIPSKIRIPIYVVIIAAFVTLLGMLLAAYAPELNKALGLFIPLIVVNCIILARAESFASKHTVTESIADGIGQGLGFTMALTILGSIREILGNGSIFGTVLFGEAFKPAIMMILPPGAFLALGIMLAIFNKCTAKKAN